MRVSGYTLLAGMLALGTAPAMAQQPAALQAVATADAVALPTDHRPRIGLVLSGGGARGVAHVGVLRVLEEMHIPIDAIAGSSMGAVVGGLYASGLSASQIDELFQSVDWSDAFSDRPARAGLNFRRRREDRDFLVRLPLGFRDGRFLLPSGLIQGQKLTQLLRKNTLQVSGIADFDHLPTPFRAVATDLETGAAVVMKDGDLTTALHASLSAPGVFAPVERNGRLLVDGGIANNLPIDVARAMGVDRLIVVDVGLPLGQRDRLGSVTKCREPDADHPRPAPGEPAGRCADSRGCAGKSGHAAHLLLFIHRSRAHRARRHARGREHAGAARRSRRHARGIRALPGGAASRAVCT